LKNSDRYVLEISHPYYILYAISNSFRGKLLMHLGIIHTCFGRTLLTTPDLGGRAS
jgi:hypothetical protein